MEKSSNILKASDVAALLKCSESKAYAVMHKLNDELEQKGFYIIHGRISERYLYERLYINVA